VFVCVCLIFAVYSFYVISTSQRGNVWGVSKSIWGIAHTGKHPTPTEWISVTSRFTSALVHHYWTVHQPAKD